MQPDRRETGETASPSPEPALTLSPETPRGQDMDFEMPRDSGDASSSTSPGPAPDTRRTGLGHGPEQEKRKRSRRETDTFQTEPGTREGESKRARREVDGDGNDGVTGNDPSTTTSDTVTGTKWGQPGPYRFTHMQGDEEFEPMEDGPEWVHRDPKRGRWLTVVNVRQMGLFREEEADKAESLVDRWLSEVKETLANTREYEIEEDAWDDVKVAEEGTGRRSTVYGPQNGPMGIKANSGMLATYGKSSGLSLVR